MLASKAAQRHVNTMPIYSDAIDAAPCGGTIKLEYMGMVLAFPCLTSDAQNMETTNQSIRFILDSHIAVAILAHRQTRLFYVV